MVRAVVLYAAEPDADAYAHHVELCRRVGGASFRHGPIFGSPFGDPRHRYYAEFEFPDHESFQAVARGEEMAATGRDAAEMGIPHSVYVTEVG